MEKELAWKARMTAINILLENASVFKAYLTGLSSSQVKLHWRTQGTSDPLSVQFFFIFIQKCYQIIGRCTIL